MPLSFRYNQSVHDRKGQYRNSYIGGGPKGRVEEPYGDSRQAATRLVTLPEEVDRPAQENGDENGEDGVYQHDRRNDPG